MATIPTNPSDGDTFTDGAGVTWTYNSSSNKWLIPVSAAGGGGGMPVGSVIYHAASSPPTGFIKANGASLSTSTYADLFAAIGYTFGGSGGSFNVPDLRGEFLRGWDDGRGVDSGRGFGSSQSWAIENITGTFTDVRTRLNTQYSTSGAFSGSTGATSGDNGNGGAATVNFAFDASNVVNTSTETRPRNIALLACIKT